jgi:hypothetical protein
MLAFIYMFSYFYFLIRSFLLYLPIYLKYILDIASLVWCKHYCSWMLTQSGEYLQSINSPMIHFFRSKHIRRHCINRILQWKTGTNERMIIIFCTYFLQLSNTFLNTLPLSVNAKSVRFKLFSSFYAKERIPLIIKVQFHFQLCNYFAQIYNKPMFWKIRNVFQITFKLNFFLNGFFQFLSK